MEEPYVEESKKDKIRRFHAEHAQRKKDAGLKKVCTWLPDRLVLVLKQESELRGITLQDVLYEKVKLGMEK